MARQRKISLLAEPGLTSDVDVADVDLLDDLAPEDIDDIQNLFVLSSAIALPDFTPVIRRANEAKHLRGLLIHQDRDPNWITSMLERAELRTLRHTFVHSDPGVFRRILNAWRIGAEDELIADATLQDGVLLVKNCALDTLETDIADLEPLGGRSDDQLAHFDVASDGSHLHWPDLDVHLDLESIRTTADPELREQMRAERLKSDRLLGRAIRSLRNDAGLRQRDVPDLSPRQVRRIEHGETTPRTDTLRQFAEGHALELNTYLDRLAEEMQRLRGQEAAE